MFLIEGIRPVGEAVEAGVPIEAIYYAPDQLRSDYALQLIKDHQHAGIPCFPTSSDVFETLADKDNPQGILAVARQVEHTLLDFSPHNLPWGVALVSPQDPGNLGTILRTIDAVGASGLLLLDSTLDVYHPGVVRASMGALFWHPVIEASFAEFSSWASRYAYHVYGTSAHAKEDYRSVTYPSPRILLLGSEREGLSQAQMAACELTVSLPMLGRVTSLNLGVAAGIMLYAMLQS